ncbi:hypothetical protein LMH87_000801 [Akanthomyces muscarius]|uniref:NAD(P)-binding domain-containing protein n=1 Tax=Akanthomyces muscarius TaxID=2231603 RepID=A0A9W8QIM8_AKAMU|nr:hypothetical protein LMH87_000801 [Akanthomyces muscarius]KAJ4155563.1 hypothetical protein LMH87_000801 [Akanthomyces muscarius]
MRPLLFFCIAEEAIASGGGLKRPSSAAVFGSARSLEGSLNGAGINALESSLAALKEASIACTITRPGTLVQEDKAPAHNHYIQQRIYEAYESLVGPF